MTSPALAFLQMALALAALLQPRFCVIKHIDVAIVDNLYVIGLRL